MAEGKGYMEGLKFQCYTSIAGKKRMKRILGRNAK